MSETEKLQAVYDLEFNITLKWFWDSGVQAVFGDKINGEECEYFDNVATAVDWLYDKAMAKAKTYPDGSESCDGPNSADLVIAKWKRRGGG